MKNLKYIFMVLLGGTMYGTMSSFVKIAYSRGYHAAELSFLAGVSCRYHLVLMFLVHER